MRVGSRKNAGAKKKEVSKKPPSLNEFIDSIILDGIKF